MRCCVLQVSGTITLQSHKVDVGFGQLSFDTDLVFASSKDCTADHTVEVEADTLTLTQLVAALALWLVLRLGGRPLPITVPVFP